MVSLHWEETVQDEPRDLLYLDSAATTPLTRSVLVAMEPYLRPGRSGNALAEARTRAARTLGVEPTRFLFTSGGTGSNNLGIGWLCRTLRSRGEHVLSQPTEHPSVLRPLEALAREGFEVEWLPVSRDGLVDPDDLRAALRSDTVLVSVMLANHETGVIQPTARLGGLCLERGVLFHVDGVQGLRYLRSTLDELRADLISISGHKLNGPKGIGGLATSARVPPLPGDADVPPALAIGFAAALEARAALSQSAVEGVRASRDALQERTLETVPDVAVNGGGAPRLPGHLNLSIHGVSGEAVVLGLDTLGIAASSGAACASGETGPSAVLLAMGRTPAEAQASVRFTLSRPLAAGEVERVTVALGETVQRLRSLSPR